MREKILKRIEELERKVEEIGTIYEDFDPSDGGNFDDTYFLGEEHGEIRGKLEAFYEVLGLLSE